ncbi:hypothetical protein F5878DRAFT_509700, partial [Lentinula raphanica]
VDPDRLRAFLEAPERHGPGLRCTRLDTSGRNTEELINSDWNQMFILNLSNECQAIAESSRDPNRFAKRQWAQVARERVYRILLDVAGAVPKAGETKKQAL